jgi:hypothetical protein
MDEDNDRMTREKKPLICESLISEQQLVLTSAQFPDKKANPANWPGSLLALQSPYPIMSGEKRPNQDFASSHPYCLPEGCYFINFDCMLLKCACQLLGLSLLQGTDMKRLLHQIHNRSDTNPYGI